jgi:hypothetical protein
MKPPATDSNCTTRVATALGRLPQYAEMISGLYTRGSPSLLSVDSTWNQGGKISEFDNNLLLLCKSKAKTMELFHCSLSVLMQDILSDRALYLSKEESHTGVDGDVALHTSTSRRLTFSSANCSSRRFWPRRPRMSEASCSSSSICLRTRWISLDISPNLFVVHRQKKDVSARSQVAGAGGGENRDETTGGEQVSNLRCRRCHCVSSVWSEGKRWRASAPWRRRGRGEEEGFGAGGGPEAAGVGQSHRSA